ncbi:type II toxin-antitoxin system VapB family antitoxin [Notoacmeibacter sp. MSK16QG-6]|uniref:type II toxin-antitoxin system VapB family antitoxin n=1 Tax=Notoacmeibacter sp. MSK16QG-6 TaxID=2957982 RepID=UPI00209FB356|nr:type II toxin-antitoxin system VapB family antitoxin [Notoacmeibacter sp. MSK16QG-6]MCP1198752.1 type II toxin-antitoxin system VapB family antitoxin [Notoacmeibacter sp. MSK16QG-6]
MGLNIKDEAVVALARKLAKATNDTMTGVIRKALERLEAQRGEAEEHAVEERLRQMDKAEAEFPKFRPGATSDHSEFYDENGMPA